MVIQWQCITGWQGPCFALKKPREESEATASHSVPGTLGSAPARPRKCDSGAPWQPMLTSGALASRDRPQRWLTTPWTQSLSWAWLCHWGVNNVPGTPLGAGKTLVIRPLFFVAMDVPWSRACHFNYPEKVLLQPKQPQVFSSLGRR